MTPLQARHTLSKLCANWVLTLRTGRIKDREGRLWDLDGVGTGLEFFGLGGSSGNSQEGGIFLQSNRHVRVVRTQSLFFKSKGSSIKRLGLFILPAVLIIGCQVIEGNGEERAVIPECLCFLEGEEQVTFGFVILFTGCAASQRLGYLRLRGAVL